MCHWFVNIRKNRDYLQKNAKMSAIFSNSNILNKAKTPFTNNNLDFADRENQQVSSLVNTSYYDNNMIYNDATLTEWLSNNEKIFIKVFGNWNFSNSRDMWPLFENKINNYNRFFNERCWLKNFYKNEWQKKIYKRKNKPRKFQVNAPLYKFRTDFFINKYLRVFTDIKYGEYKASRNFDYSSNINKHYFPKLVGLLGINVLKKKDIFYNHFFFEKWCHKYNYKNDTINLSNWAFIKQYLLKYTKIKAKTLIKHKSLFIKKLLYKNIKIKNWKNKLLHKWKRKNFYVSSKKGNKKYWKMHSNFWKKIKLQKNYGNKYKLQKQHKRRLFLNKNFFIKKFLFKRLRLVYKTRNKILNKKNNKSKKIKLFKKLYKFIHTFKNKRLPLFLKKNRMQNNWKYYSVFNIFKYYSRKNKNFYLKYPMNRKERDNKRWFVFNKFSKKLHLYSKFYIKSYFNDAVFNQKKKVISLNRMVFNKKIYNFNNYFESNNKLLVNNNLYKNYVNNYKKINSYMSKNKNLLHIKDKWIINYYLFFYKKINNIYTNKTNYIAVTKKLPKANILSIINKQIILLTKDSLNYLPKIQNIKNNLNKIQRLQKIDDRIKWKYLLLFFNNKLIKNNNIISSVFIKYVKQFLEYLINLFTFNNWFRLYLLCLENIKNNNLFFALPIFFISTKKNALVFRSINFIIKENNIYFNEKK